jgi:hypothetical protein
MALGGQHLIVDILVEVPREYFERLVGEVRFV